jgi:hypothetical protein
MTDTRNTQDAGSGMDEALRQRRMRRFSLLTTLTLIVLCNAIILFSIWASGINLDGLFHTPDHFSPSRDVCLRYNWHKVSGVQQPVRLCYEWINLSDPTGNTHTFQEDTDIVLGADGKLHYEHGGRVDPRLFILLAFVGAVLALGMVVSRFLIARYRVRQEASSNARSS